MENWKDVKGYEGIYQVSDAGNIRTVDGKATTRTLNGVEQERHWRGRMLKQKTDKGGYKRVSLWRRKTHKDFLVHRLVCDAFHLNPELKPDVNHIDGNPSNNRADNLEWATPRENLMHAYRHRLNREPHPVALYDHSDDVTRHFVSLSEASRFLGKNAGYVSRHIKDGHSKVDGYEIFVRLMEAMI